MSDLRMDRFVKRVKPSQQMADLASMFDQAYPGIAVDADRLYACVSLAAKIAEDHPDLNPSSDGIIKDLATALFTAPHSVVKLAPEGEEGKEEGADDGGVRPSKIEVCDPESFPHK